MGLKSKLFMAVATSAAGATMIAGGTFAMFTDTSANTGNTFTAGTVVVDATQGGTPVFASDNLTFNNMAPGDSGNTTIKVMNTGTLGEWVKINSINTTGNLFDATTTSTDTVNGQTQTANNYPLALTPNADLTSGQTGYFIPAGGSTTIQLNYAFPLNAGNYYQGQTGTATINVEAVQARNNSTGTEPTVAGAGAGPSNGWGA